MVDLVTRKLFEQKKMVIRVQNWVTLAVWELVAEVDLVLFCVLKQGNYSLRRPPKLTIPQAVIEQRWATVNSNLYKQTCMLYV